MAIRKLEDKTSVILLQSGIGVPNHISPKSTLFFDTDAAIAYINKDNLASWAYLIDSTMVSGGTFGTDVYVTGGTFDNIYGTATFTNNTGGTFTVSGFNTASGSTASTPTISACTSIFTNMIVSCSGNSVIFLASGETTFNTSITPVIDATIDVGTTFRRFRAVNTVSGTSTVWTATTSVTTPSLILGLDSSGNTRTITADNSIIQNDLLNNGSY